MAVLVEAISVVVRKAAIQQRLPGGWPEFEALVPNSTLCADEHLARVGFMVPADVKAFVDLLIGQGLVFLRDGKAVDLVVIDQQQGPTAPCEWLDFARLPWMKVEQSVAACWLRASATHGMPIMVAVPTGWAYEQSLSRQFGYVPTGSVPQKLKFLRKQDGLDVYLDLETNCEVFVGRA